MPGNLVNLVVRLRPRRFTSARARGFTLLEVQVASIIFVVAVFFLIGQARAYRALLESVERESALVGVAVQADERVVASVARSGAGSAAPACEVRLHSLDNSGASLEAELVVTRRAP